MLQWARSVRKEQRVPVSGGWKRRLVETNGRWREQNHIQHTITYYTCWLRQTTTAGGLRGLHSSSAQPLQKRNMLISQTWAVTSYSMLELTPPCPTHLYKKRNDTHSSQSLIWPLIFTVIKKFLSPKKNLPPRAIPALFISEDHNNSNFWPQED